MKVRKLATIAAAVSMAVAPVAANAASALSVSRAMAPMVSASHLQDEDGDNIGGGSTALIIGVAILVALAAVAISGNDEIARSP